MKFEMDENEKKVLKQVREIYDFISNIKEFSKLIPEVRTNISVSLGEAKSSEDIAAIDGRITVVNGMPKACGSIKFGASDHTARLLLTVKNFNKNINVVINLRYLEEVIEKLKTNSSLFLIEIDRTKEPENLKKEEHSTMQWLIKQVVDKNGTIPDIIWDKGAIGKEPMIRLFAENADQMINKLRTIVKLIK